MDTKGLEKPILMAGIYGVIFLLSAVIAFVLFKFLPSTASVEGVMGGYAIKLGGAIAGFIASFWVWHLAYSKITQPKKLEATGTVLLDGEPLEGAKVYAGGDARTDTSKAGGHFSLELNPAFSSWTLYAVYEQNGDSFSAEHTVTQAQLKKIHTLSLKKKARPTRG